jgi:hypothetical protein
VVCAEYTVEAARLWGPFTSIVPPWVLRMQSVCIILFFGLFLVSTSVLCVCVAQLGEWLPVGSPRLHWVRAGSLWVPRRLGCIDYAGWPLWHHARHWLSRCS